MRAALRGRTRTRAPAAARSATAARSLPTSGLRLRPVAPADLDAFFRHQADPVAVQMAAFTAETPGDRVRFDRHWSRVLADPAIVARTIELEAGEVVGHVLSFEQFGDREVSYWLAREHWGRGIATEALAAFLGQVPQRPLFARAAKDNAGSLRVLQKCGFAICGEDKGFASGRGAVTEEYLLRLGPG
jgi:RimJ/RimL family protein N-acetyltransferase